MTTTPLPSLRQARLIGINEHIKSVRQKPKIPSPAPEQPKQTGLAAFGFGSTSRKTPARQRANGEPPPKRQKGFSVGLEIPETQCGQNTQSPEFPCDYEFSAISNGFVVREGDRYSSSSLSSPPPEISPVLPSPAGSLVGMESPSAPVTPRRSRVTEIPDSKSPPVTPFTPYASRQRNNRLSSPIGRTDGSPIVSWIQEDFETSDECNSPTSTSTLAQVLPQRLLVTSSRAKQPKRNGKNRYEERRKPRETERANGGAEKAVEDRDRVIKSSQWWENEDTQNFLLSTQVPQQGPVDKVAIFSGNIGHIMGLHEYGVRIEPNKQLQVDVSYKSDPPVARTDENSKACESRDSSRVDQVNIQESFCNDSVLPLDDSFSGSTGSESQEFPSYGAYRTQQFPSSFFQHSSYQPSSPEPPQSPQLIPFETIHQSNTVEGGVSRGQQKLSQFVPGMLKESLDEIGATTGIAYSGGLCENHDNGNPSRSPLGMVTGLDVVAAIVNSQLFEAQIEEPDGIQRCGWDDYYHQDIDSKRVFGTGGGGGGGERACSCDKTITRSQLLPSELMETFPMPPPLSQSSSHGPYDYNENETQN